MYRAIRSLSRSGLILAALGLSALAAGCSGAATNEPATASTGATKAAVATAARGPDRLIAEALSTVSLRPDQRTQIQQLQTDAETRHSAARTARAAILTALADQIEHGNVDRAALAPQLEAARTSMAASRPADQAALVRLHDILDSTQRGQLVDALESRIDSMKAEHTARKGAMKEWAAELGLTDAQRTQIHDAMRAEFAQGHGDWKGAKERHHAMLESFRGETFSAPTGSPTAPPTGTAEPARMAGRMLRLAEVATPILTPQQRSLAAAKLRARAAELAADSEP